MTKFIIRSHSHNDIEVFSSATITDTAERQSELDAIRFCDERRFKLKGSRLWTDTTGCAWLMDSWGELLPVPNVRLPWPGSSWWHALKR